ncbi:hypothetical protein HYW84_00760 [Candidatus Peregrinibacteria bacterium]|nr:hypothetical protein [Candidatus Peregrinibacteria bacterium]
MCSIENKGTKMFFGIYFLPPILFYLFLVPQHVGTRYVVDHRCGGRLFVTASRLNENVAPVGRVYDGDDCVGQKYIDSDRDLTRNFGEIIGKLNPLLKYKVCFDRRTSIDNGRNVENDVKEIILEEHNKLPSKLRIEADSRKGFEVFQGACEEIPDWAQGRLRLMPLLIEEKMDKELFEQLKMDKLLVPSLEDPSIYENEVFIEDTTITVKPKLIQLYVFLGILIGWVFIVFQVVNPLIKEYHLLTGNR